MIKKIKIWAFGPQKFIFFNLVDKKKNFINLNKNIFDPKTLSNPFKNIKLNQIKKSQVSIYIFPAY
jgi:hypothetical protein